MKAIVGTIMAVMLSLGVYASQKNSGGKLTNHPENEISVELLNILPELKAGENGTIEMSSAFIEKQNDSSDELFGSFWAEFEFEEGNSSNMYEIKNWKINDIRLADELSLEEKAEIEKALYIELKLRFDELPKSTIDGILNSSDKNVNKGFNNDAPAIIYTNQPSALIVIDREPYYDELDKRYSKVSNAGAFIVKDNKKDVHYMYGGGLWFSSANALHSWEYIDNVPNRINRVMKKHARNLYDNMQNEQFQARIIPEIIVTTTPSELISTEGSPKFVLIPNTNLVFVENSDAELFRDLNTNNFYSLFSGRWFVSDKLEGNWQYVNPRDLPADFTKIPEDHEKSNVLVSVPGTKAAENAIRDAQIPYITKRDISTTLDTKVNYNGDPKFEIIQGTGLLYAINTSNPVLLWNNSYYLVDDAVWYKSSTPNGPWQIATLRPEGVENIPADNPLYNIKYVHIYKNTDRVVYTGYTSGYTGSYIYGPTVVFGTGFHYYGWYGHYYYHHPMTYGYGFIYDPFYGWVPVYSPWYYSSFYWHWNWNWHWNWHWHHWYGHRPSHHQPPGLKPEHPIERPGRPERPTALPEQPATRPNQPESRPSQPVTRPVQPAVQPAQPAIQPGQPAYNPARPSVRPVQPAGRPAPGPALRR